MTDNPNPNPSYNGTNNVGTGGGTDPKKPDNQNPEVKGLNRLGDEEFGKLASQFFDDNRTYKHPRFKSLRERAQQADKYEADEQKNKEKKLLEEKKYTELIAEKDKQIASLTEANKAEKLNTRIIAEAQKVGTVDIEAVLRLIDRSGITYDQNGVISGVEQAVKALLDSKPYLRGQGNKPIVGSPTSPGVDGLKPGMKFKLSQLQNAKFYKEHNQKGEIDEAFRLNQVENDLP
jgi:hypothetical protein